MRKTKKAVSQRFKLTKSGHIKRARSGSGHLLTGKSRKRKRNLRKDSFVAKVDERRIGRLLPHG
jgi:large subunit ribosomal protein L35